MALVNKTIPGLYGGVSQQTPELRHDTQVTEMINCYPTIMGGVSKRPGTETVYQDDEFPTDSFIYTYDRGDGESYIVCISDGMYRVFDVALGSWVDNWIGNDYLTLAEGSTISNKDAFALTTVGDTTFITNKTKITSMNTSLTEDAEMNSYFIEIPRGYDILPQRITRYTISYNSKVNTKKINLTSDYSKIQGTLSIVVTAGSLGAQTFSQYIDITTSSPLSSNGISISSKIKQLLAKFDNGTTVFVSDNMLQSATDYPVTCTVTWTPSSLTTQSLDYPDTDMGESMNATQYNNSTTVVSYSVPGGKLEGDHYVYSQAAPNWDKTFYYWIKRTAGGSDSTNQPLRYTYKLFKDGSPSVYVSAIDHDSTSAITSLYNSIGSPFTNKSYKGSVLRVEMPDGHSLEGADSWGNQASESFLGKAKKIQDLPNSLGFNGAVFEITGDENTSFDNFYVRYQDGAYLETVRPGLVNGIQKESMPHVLKLRRQDDGSYVQMIEPFNWAPRKCGDLNTASLPSFIGNSITDIFFYRNRLGFISGDNVILSEVGVYDNFWPTTVTSIVDSDPIDVAVDTNTVVKLQHAIPFQKDMLLIGNNSQFVLTSQAALTPLDVSVQQSTSYEAKNVKPISVGPNVYFVSERNNFSSIREYYVESDTTSNVANDITAHVPSYIPVNITKVAASPRNNMLFVLSKETPNTVYVYNYFFTGSERQQSAWHKWVFNGSDNIEIFNIEVLDGYLLLMIKRDTQIFLERIPLEFSLEIEYTNVSDGSASNVFESTIVLSKPGFTTGKENVDDPRGVFILRNIKFNTSYGSFYNVAFHKLRRPLKYTSISNVGLSPLKDRIMTTEFKVKSEGAIYPSEFLFPSDSLLPEAISYTMPSDNKYPIAGNADTIEIEITNKLPIGFRINTLDLFGIYTKNSRNV